MHYVEVHRHRWQQTATDQGSNAPVFVSDTTAAFTYTDTTEGSANFSVKFKVPLALFDVAVKTGDWLVVRQRSGVCVAFGHVSNVNGGLNVGAGGAITTTLVTASCVSWFDFLGQCSVYCPVGWAETRGTLYSLVDWATLNVVTMQEYVTGSVGVALAKMHKLLARVRLPESLGGEFIGDAIPIVHDDDTQKRWAPLRRVESVSVANGLPSQFSFEFADSKLQELYYGSFVPDRGMIEMFPSLEVPAEEHDSAQQWQDPGPEYQPLSALAKHLGRNPVLIYRMRPWRARPLIEAAVVEDNFVHDPDDILKALVSVQSARAIRGDLVPMPPADAVAMVAEMTQTARATAKTSEETRYAQAQLLGEFINGKPPLFSETTWDLRDAVEIPLEMVRGITFSWDDSRRVNCTSITLSTDSSTGIEAAVPLGMPITNDESIVEQGLRLAKPSWPFTIPKRGDNSWIPYMRSVACQKMQFEQSAHLMSEGQIEVNWRDADGSGIERLRAGELIQIAFPHRTEPFVAYAQQVSSTVAARGDGGLAGKTTVFYTRGLFGQEQIRKARFPVRAGQSAVIQRSGGMATPPVAAPAPQPVVAPGDVDGTAVVAEARRLWLQEYINPFRTVERPRTLELINKLLRTEYGISRYSLNGSSDYTHAQYIADQQLAFADQRTNYCGAFAAHCWREVGLSLPLRTQWYGTGTLVNYANYHHTGNPAIDAYVQPADGSGRKMLTLTQHSTAADVAAWGVQPGDVLIVGHGYDAGRAGSHIAIVESFSVTTGKFTTYEGNASPGGQPNAYPSGTMNQVYGVVHRTRPLWSARNGDELYAVRLIRPSIHDLRPL